MRNIIILRHIRLCSLSSLLAIASTFTLYAQKNAVFVNNELRQQPNYTSLPNVYYIAILPIQGCFDCIIMLGNQIKDISKNNNKIVFIYPSTRKIVQEKIKKENKIELNKAFYVFDDVLYQKLYDSKAPKGYILKVAK